jgi:hypothetical protein
MDFIQLDGAADLVITICGQSHKQPKIRLHTCSEMQENANAVAIFPNISNRNSCVMHNLLCRCNFTFITCGRSEIS